MKKILNHPLADPKNPIWLEILRRILVGGSLILLALVFLSSLLSFFNFVQEGFAFALGYFLGTNLVGIPFIALFYIIGMIALNSAFNLQQIRINTDKK